MMKTTSIAALPFLCIMVVIGPISNFVIAHYFLFKSQQKSVYHLFLVHLAIVDMFACIIIPILLLPQEIMNGQWFFGETACKYFFHIPIGLTVYSSCWILFGIIADRYRAIVYPLAARFTRRNIHLYCSVIWLVSIAQVIPQHINDDIHVTSNNKTRCVEIPLATLPREGELLFAVFNCLLQCVIPVTLIAIFLYRTEKTLVKTTHATNKSTDLNLKLRFYRNKCIMRLLRRTLSIYVFTVTMNTIGHLVRTVVKLYFPDMWARYPWIENATSICIHLIFINNTVNCFIYAGTILPFRTYILRLFPFLDFRGRIMRRRQSSTIHRNILLAEFIVDNYQDGTESGSA